MCYVGRDYWFYVPGAEPGEKSPEEIDRQLIAKYGIDISKYQRRRRKLAGRANIQYPRYGRNCFLWATYGGHSFFQEKGNVIAHVWRKPISFGGYYIGYKDGRLRGADRGGWAEKGTFRMRQRAPRPS